MFSDHDPHGYVLDSGAKAYFYSNNIKWSEIMTLMVIAKFLTRALKTTFIFKNMFAIPWHDFGFVMPQEGCCVLSQLLGLLPFLYHEWTNNLQYYKTLGYVNIQVHNYSLSIKKKKKVHSYSIPIETIGLT